MSNGSRATGSVAVMIQICIIHHLHLGLHLQVYCGWLQMQLWKGGQGACDAQARSLLTALNSGQTVGSWRTDDQVDRSWMLTLQAAGCQWQ